MSNESFQKVFHNAFELGFHWCLLAFYVWYDTTWVYFLAASKVSRIFNYRKYESNISQVWFCLYSYFVWYLCREMQLSLTPCSCAMENYVLYLSDICVHCLHNHFIIIIIVSLRVSVSICIRVCTYVCITMYWQYWEPILDLTHFTFPLCNKFSGC